MSEWKKERIDYAVTTYAGGTPNRSRDDYFNGDIPWISSGEVNQSYINKTKEYITLLGLENSSAKWIPKGAVLLAMYGATAGQVAKLKIRATANQAVLALLPNEEILDKDFLYHLLNIEKDKILFFAQGSGQPNLSKGLIDRYFISFPESKNTQIGIAKILDTIDTVIEQTQSAIAKYKAIKQGLLHDLFTCGLTANGRLRPSYHDAPELYKESELGMIPKEWEVKRLEEIAYVNPPTNIPSTFNSKTQVTFLKMEDVSNGGTIINNRSLPIGNVQKRGFTLFQENDILFAKITPCMENGKGALAINLFNGIGFGSTEFHVFRPRDKKSISYVYFLSVSSKFRLQAESQMTGSAGQQRVSTKYLENYKIAAPQLDEQFQFGIRLNNIDNKIHSEETLLQKYQSIKRGLMGDLLGGRKEGENLNY
jgi:type I restriction enzyme S subunit